MSNVINKKSNVKKANLIEIIDIIIEIIDVFTSNLK